MPTFSRLHMYLEVAGNSNPITGEVADLDFLRQISLTSFNWDMAHKKADVEKNIGAGDRGRPEPGIFRIGKFMDKASTQMLSKLTAGTKLNASITLAAQEESNFRFTAKLSNIRIIEYTVNGKDGDKSGEVDEDWSFNYDSIRLEYVPELAPNEKVAKPLSSEHKRSAQASTETGAGLKKVISAYEELTALDKKSAADSLKIKYDKDGYFK